jgi:glycosyltransferase involved in cell wall biosynthesis
MNIGFFSPTINRIGGGEWVTLNMINSLKERGHKIAVCSAWKLDSQKIFEVFGRRIHYDKEIRFWPYVFDPYDPKSIYENTVKSFMCKLRCDMLIDTFSNSLLPWSDAVYFQGGALVSVLPRGLRGSFFVPFRTLLKHFSKSSHFKSKIAMACSKFSAQQIEEATGHKVEVLYPPVSDFFKATNDSYENSRSNLVVTVSRFSKEKRLELVPEIAKLSPPNTSFIVVGACRSAEALLHVQSSIRNLGVEKNVRLMPNTSRRELRRLLRKAKVYLHTGENEPFGVSIVEAMSSGCIPIVPDSGGPKEFVPEQFRYESVDEAACLIESCMSEWTPRKAEEFAKLSARFSEEAFCKEFLKIMKL